MTTLNLPDVAAFIGIDWSDTEHAVCLQAADSNRVESLSLLQKPEALHDWVNQLRERFGGRPVAIALEQSRGALIYALMTCDFVVLYPVNPKMLARYREVFSGSGAKDDPTDALLLLQLLRVHGESLHPLVPDTAQTRTVQLLSEHRRKAVNDRTRLTNRLTRLLKDSFPQALDWAGDLKRVQACDWLIQWPSLLAIQKARPSQIRAFYGQHRGTGPDGLEVLLSQIRAARPLTTDPAVLTASSVAVQTLAAQLRPVIAAIDQFVQQLEERFEQHPDHAIYESLPGAGKVLGSRLLAAMGSRRDRFGSALEIQQFSGIAPVTKRSGRSCVVHRRFACPKFVRQSFHEFAKSSIPWSPWAHAFYDQQRAQGNKHHAAVRALAYKWIRIIYRCWKEQTPYDEQKYLQALQRRQSPLCAAIASAEQNKVAA